jgi:hypothetical protein
LDEDLRAEPAAGGEHVSTADTGIDEQLSKLDEADSLKPDT